MSFKITVICNARWGLEPLNFSNGIPDGQWWVPLARLLSNFEKFFSACKVLNVYWLGAYF